MPVYTTITKLDYWLPANLPDTITETLKAAIIMNASAQIDAYLVQFPLGYASNTQKFPDVTDDPPTPEVLDEICQWLAAYRIFTILKEINKTEYKQGASLRKMAIDELEKINRGDIAIILSDGTAIEPSSRIYHTHYGFTPPVKAGLATFPYIARHPQAEDIMTSSTTSSSLIVRSQSFVDQTSVTITHNLDYEPEVWILDTEGMLISATVVHAVGAQSFTVEFAEPQSGTIYYR